MTLPCQFVLGQHFKVNSFWPTNISLYQKTVTGINKMCASAGGEIRWEEIRWVMFSSFITAKQQGALEPWAWHPQSSHSTCNYQGCSCNIENREKHWRKYKGDWFVARVFNLNIRLKYLVCYRYWSFKNTSFKKICLETRLLMVGGGRACICANYRARL